MGKWIKRIAVGFGALAAVALIAAFIYREPLERLYRVNTLFDGDRIVGNFSNMRSMFLSTDIPRNGPVFTFGEAPSPLPETFQGRDQVKDVTAFLEETNTTSLLVIRDDKIEYEAYFNETGMQDQRISWSVAKSYLSTLIGVALAEGDIASLDDPVTKYAPSLAGSAYDGATIRNVANMASGVAFDEDYLDYDSDINKMGRELALGGSLDEFAAGLTERAGAPGENWRYVSIDTHVLGMVLRGATGETVADYMADELWSRIGVEADAYYVTDGEGAAFVLGGLNIRTRDYAKLGRLFLRDGDWEGEQIIPAAWTRESTAQSAPPPADPDHKLGYGYQWWLPAGADEEFFAIGVYGQYIWVDRKANVVIVKTSADRNFRANGNLHQHDSIALFRKISRP